MMKNIAPFLARAALLLLAALALAGVPATLFAQDGGASRSVNIIEQPSAAPPAPGPVDASTGPAPSEVAIANQTFQIDNSAGVSLEILPSAELGVGSKITFQVTTKRRGYLILLDIDAGGKLTQIYPNPLSLRSPAAHEALNLMNPGRGMRVPDVSNPFAGFEFVAEPPTGAAMVVAILSDQPVQLLDLPDVPPQLAGREDALAYVHKLTRNLRIARPDQRLYEGKWSFDARVYVIK